MGRQFLLELLQDRAFFFLLNRLSSLSCKQIHQSRIDPIHYQIGTLLRSSTILRHWNGLCPCFVVTGDPPICILMLNCIGENKVHPLRSKFHRDRKYGYYYFYVCIVNGKLSGLKFASISTSVTLLVTNRQSFLGSLSDFGLPSNANVFGVFVNCNWAVNVRLAINGNFYAYQIATVSNDATFTLNFVVAYK